MKRKSVQQAFNEISVRNEFDKDLFKTARFWFEGFELLQYLQ